MITSACVSTAEPCIPYTRERHFTPGRVPGWREQVEPFRQKSIFWHRKWVDCGRPRNSVAADCMRRTCASYHYAVRRVKQNEESVVRERIANACMDDPSRSFWAEVQKIRHMVKQNKV